MKDDSKQRRQRQVDALEECKWLLQEGKDIPNDMGWVLWELAQQAKIPHRPLNDTLRTSRDLIIWNWASRRKYWIDNKLLPKKTATDQAVDRAKAEIEAFERAFGPKLHLKEKTIRDRVVREPKLPRPRSWWKK